MADETLFEIQISFAVLKEYLGTNFISILFESLSVEKISKNNKGRENKLICT